ncbi:glycosyltransferase family 2 protein [Streptomyces sp. H27-C3]|uniref:glycosyltransferase family 2 protein n=1 Tax=Streptomyces sp. H27-C3 TaxID=3046305 RepID=UPI0024B8B168|nr:glycosyltransferase family 2 protein [Streptomyces sp. H27-C3]MDJ0466815.1 glycosyltransferase family 2 protein [Streptomyces sp. H27-C3]
MAMKEYETGPEPVGVPDVSVVIGAFEGMPYLIKCLESVEAQTLGAERMEILAINDGSTDGTGAYLDDFAAKSKVPMRVVHQANSGGPASPRNRGLELARGRFVFFLDADDYLGEEALERMVDMADRNKTDVVLGKIEGLGRSAPKSMFGRTEQRTDIFSSRIMYTLSAEKLFRRELLEKYSMRFDEDLYTGEDQQFTLEAYVRGAGVSVEADYVCLYIIRRDDGKHITQSGGYDLRFDSARALMDLIAELFPEGEKRDHVMIRPFVITLLPHFDHRMLKLPEATRRDKIALAKPLMEKYWTPGAARRLKVPERLRMHLVAEGKLEELQEVIAFIRDKKEPEIVRKGRENTPYLAYPYFGDESVGVPDEMYKVTVAETVGGKRVVAAKPFRPAPQKPKPTFARRVVRKLRRMLREMRNPARA